MQKNSSGFTLIELLVVVLIIGILAAVALPQYQKAVMKARITEIMQVQNALVKAFPVWYLEQGHLPQNEDVSFFGTDANASLDVNPMAGMTCGTTTCSSKNFSYNFGFYAPDGYAALWVEYGKNPGPPDGASISIDIYPNGTTEKTCFQWDADGEVFCSAMKSLDNSYNISD